MEQIKTLIRAILAGIFISVGCIVYSSCDNKYIGACLFSVGLLSVLTEYCNLYTGQVCYIPLRPPEYVIDVAISLIGNIIGCAIMGLCFPVATVELCMTKLSFTPFEILCKSAMCGLLIYLAVSNYRNKQGNITMVVFCIPVFILSGYIHVVADSFYFISARVFSIDVLAYIALAAIGNGIGGMLIPFLYSTKLMK